MKTCPALLVTAMPGRDSWALEELLDTVVEADPMAKVEATRYRGTFLVRSSLDPARLARRFLAYTHAFVARVVPVLWCGPLEELDQASWVSARYPGAALDVRAREPLKDRLTEALVRQTLGVRGQGAEYVIDIENVDEVVLVSAGRLRSCGPHCVVLVP